MADILRIQDGSGNFTNVTSSGTYQITVPDTQPKLTIQRVIDGCVSATTQEICAGIPSTTRWDLTDPSNFTNTGLVVTDPSNNAQLQAAAADIQTTNPLSAGLGTEFTFPGGCVRATNPYAGYAVFTHGNYAGNSAGLTDEVAYLYDFENLSAQTNSFTSTLPLYDSTATTPQRQTIARFADIGQVFDAEVNHSTGDIFLGASNAYWRAESSNEVNVPGAAGSTGIYKIAFSDVGTQTPAAFVTTTTLGTNVIGTTTLPGTAVVGSTQTGNNNQPANFDGFGVFLAADYENNLLFASVIETGGIYSINMTTGVVIDEVYPFKALGNDGVQATWDEQANGIGFNPVNREIYYMDPVTAKRSFGRNGINSIAETGTTNFYSLGVSTTGVFSPLASQTTRGSKTWSAFPGNTSNDNDNYIVSKFVFNNAGNRVVFGVLGASHLSQSEMYSVDASGNMTYITNIKEGREDASGSGDSVNGNLDFLSTSYAPLTTDDNALAIPANTINWTTSTTGVDSDRNYGFAIRELTGSGVTNLQYTQDDPSFDTSLNTWIVTIAEGTANLGAGTALGVPGTVKAFDCTSTTGIEQVFTVNCDCTISA